jgi:polysaccharide export outer membrane protein
MDKTRFFPLLGLAAFLLVGTQGCAAIDHTIRRQKPRTITVEVPREEYRLKPGDQIELFFTTSCAYDSTIMYMLEEGDEVRLYVSDREDLSGEYAVGPDGFLYFPYIDPIPARGRELSSISKDLDGAYQSQIGESRVSLTYARYKSASRDFIAAFPEWRSGAPHYSTTVTPQGSAVFPQVGTLQVAGLTLEQARAMILGRFHGCFPSIEVTLQLRGGGHRFVTVLGQVESPGAYEVSGDLSVATLLGLAGGWRETAYLESVIHISQRTDGLVVQKIDLEKELIIASLKPVHAGDLVFVPARRIVNLNDWIDRYIRRNLPINVYAPIPVTEF